jgi:formylglycine-generating enzyme required for sulfatase activity
MLGNVFEWVSDWYSDTYYSTPDATTANPQGPTSGAYRVARGGSFFDVDASTRTTYRFSAAHPEYASASFGFRCAR